MVPPALPEDGDALDRAVHQRRHGEEHVPLAAGEHGVRAPDGVHGEALVEVEQAGVVVPLHDLDELVARFLLVEEPGGGLDRARAGWP